ncbi:vacuolar protein 14 C-terminal Fig4p binding-domain-containing protein, partial [Phakopsora pachyrhizi]
VYDRRKHAAFLLEAQIKEHLIKHEYDKVDQILLQLSTLALNPNPSWRWGSVMGLAACSIALGSEIPAYLIQIVPPIINCFSDQDSKVRYFSCESMYNVAKVAKGEILVYFTDLFDCLSKLTADPDPAVKNGAELLDRLIKDIVTEQAATYVSIVPNSQPLSESNNILSSSSSASSSTRNNYNRPPGPSTLRRAFSLERFIPLLRERIYNLNPFTRQYLVSWLQLLNSIPEINLISFLPEFLDGLIKYLGDSGREIQVGVQNLMADLLLEIENVAHANEYIKIQRLQKRELRRHRLLFERRMEVPNPGLVPNDNSKKLNDDPHPGQTEAEHGQSKSEKDQVISKAINPAEEVTNVGSLDMNKLELNAQDDGENTDEDSDEGTYVQGQGIELNLGSIVEILIKWMGISDSEEIQSTCLRWIGELIKIDQSVMIPFTPRLIPIILRCLSHDRPYIKQVAIEANYDLFTAIEHLPTPPPPLVVPQPSPSLPLLPSSPSIPQNAATGSPMTQPEPEKRRQSRQFGPQGPSLIEKAKAKIAKAERASAVQAKGPLSWAPTRFRKLGAPNERIAEPLNHQGPPTPTTVKPPDEAQLPPDPLDYPLTVNSLTLQFIDQHEETRLAALKWLMMLHNKVPHKILTLEDGTFPVLLKTLSDDSESVIKSDLELLSQISLRSLKTESGYYFRHFAWNLLSLFGTDRNLLESRGNLIVRILCKNLNSERIFKTFGEYLETDEDLEFASSMVQNLNLIMITSPELSEMRKKLKVLDTRDSVQLFTNIYKSFSHNPISTLTLCLLSPMAYEHAFNLLTILANDLEITVSLLIQVDKLVQLLESPVFTSLRLQLLEPDKYPYLYKALYGILMLLPQSSAFATLRNRLGAVSNLGASHSHILPRTINSNVNSTSTLINPRGVKSASLKTSDSDSINWNSLLVHFKSVQTRHEKLRRHQQDHHLNSSSREEDHLRPVSMDEPTVAGGLSGAEPNQSLMSAQPNRPHSTAADDHSPTRSQTVTQSAAPGSGSGIPTLNHQRIVSTSTTHQQQLSNSSASSPSSKIPSSVPHGRKRSLVSTVQRKPSGIPVGAPQQNPTTTNLTSNQSVTGSSNTLGGGTTNSSSETVDLISTGVNGSSNSNNLQRSVTSSVNNLSSGNSSNNESNESL